MAHQSRGAEVPLADETLLRRALMLPFMFAGLTLAAWGLAGVIGGVLWPTLGAT